MWEGPDSKWPPELGVAWDLGSSVSSKECVLTLPTLPDPSSTKSLTMEFLFDPSSFLFGEDWVPVVAGIGL